MSLYGALFTGVSGLNAQGQKIAIISDNIANVNTVGYKEGQAQFQTLVVNAATQAAYSPGGVRNTTRINVDKQGIIQSTSAPTDIAISGNGFFAVKSNTDSSSQMLYSRAGSFRQDSTGNFVNSQGFYLQGWPLDRDGQLPGAPGNLNTISSANLESLRTVNVENSGGTANATTDLKLGINLNAGQKVQQGAGATAPIDTLSTENRAIAADQIIVPDENIRVTPSTFGLSPLNNLARGDKFTVTTGGGLNYDYTYGGFTIGRNVNIADLATNIGDAASDLTPIAFDGAVGGTGITLNNGDSFYTVDVGTPVAGLGLAIGSRVRLNNVLMTNTLGIPISEFNGIVTVASVAGNTFTVATSVAAGAIPAGAQNESNATSSFNTRLFSGNVFDATGVNQPFFSSTTNLGEYTTAARSFTISNASVPDGTKTFTYTSSSPNTQSGQFNSLATLAEAINNTAGLTARVSGGRLVVGGENANEAVTFANVDSAGNTTLRGLNWVQELDLRNITTGNRVFSTMQGLANIVNNDAGLGATITNPLSDSTLNIFNDDPLDTIRFQDFTATAINLPANPVSAVANPLAGPPATVDVTVDLVGHTFNIGDNVVLSGLTTITNGGQNLTAAELNRSHQVVAPVVAGTSFTVRVQTAATAAIVGGVGGGAAGAAQSTNQGSVLAELGIVPSLNGATYARGDSGNLGPVYDASAVTGKNMASGDITAHFSRTITVYDPLGAGHDLRVAYLKIGENKWATEIFAINKGEISTTRPDGIVAAGVIEFNGDASLKTISSELLNPVTINWTNGAASNSITLNLGNAGFPAGTTGATIIGDTSGMSQFEGRFNVSFITQNGAPVGELVGVTIDKEGFVIASFTNGETKKLYKVPIADFANPNGLRAISGNVFTQTNASGDVNLREAGQNGAGDVVSNALEASNVDLAEQLTDMIVAQRAYQSNTRVITTTDELLERLTQI
jgi:flagellar hook protein FlgE